MVSCHLFKDAWRCYSSPRPTWFSKWVRNQPNPRCTSWRLGWKGQTNNGTSGDIRCMRTSEFIDICFYNAMSLTCLGYICLWWSAALCLFWSCFWQRDASVGVGVGGPTHDNAGSFTVECFFRSTWTFHLGCQKVASRLGIQVHLAQMMARTGMSVLSGIWRTQRFHGRYNINISMLEYFQVWLIFTRLLFINDILPQIWGWLLWLVALHHSELINPSIIIFLKKKLWSLIKDVFAWAPGPPIKIYQEWPLQVFCVGVVLCQFESHVVVFAKTCRFQDPWNIPTPMAKWHRWPKNATSQKFLGSITPFWGFFSAFEFSKILFL